MKLLLDQNLSFRLLSVLEDLFPNSAHVGRMGLGDADDARLRKVAGAGGFTLVSQDADFADMVLERGPPPKVIWLRCGNRPTEFIASLLRSKAQAIFDLDRNPDVFCLEVYK